MIRKQAPHFGEMKNVIVTFEFDKDDKIPVGHKEITAHMAFDVKIALQRKARLVAARASIGG